MVVLAGMAGRLRQITSVIATTITAAAPNMLRQPKYSATKPLNTRDSKMPSSRPVITVPTVLPRCAAGESVAAAGTISCAIVAAMPTARLAISNMLMPPLKALSSNAAVSSTPFRIMI